MFQDFLNKNLPVKSQADKATKSGFVEFGYGQVEPNHLSAQRTGQIYAQLPAASSISMLEQGQFVKYDYAAANSNGVGLVDFTGAGEWMLVYNEIKLYRNHIDGSKQWDCEFAMFADDYQARIYSPYDADQAELEYHDWHKLNGVDENGLAYKIVNQYVALDIEGQSVTIDNVRYPVTNNKFTYDSVEYTIDANTKQTTVRVPVKYAYDDVTKDMEDIYEFNFTNDPFKKLGIYREKKMPAGTSMVPRVFKTNVGDIFTTNMIAESSVVVGDILCPRDADGILAKVAEGATPAMKWQVVKVYTMPDGQQGAKLMRIA